jgi:negative regulator of sigma E activity
MTRKLEIEANLDRSLARQVKAPRLDRRFDAAVWARIEAAEQRATNPVPQSRASSSARWLFFINVIGVASAALLVVIFGLQSLSGASVHLPLPEVSATTGTEILRFATQTVTIVSLVFGLLFTPIGRRLRAEFL